MPIILFRNLLKIMKILHTSDWHIGKRLIRRDRSEEFRSVLGEIAEICKSEDVELCLIAGDVFDTYTPSAEAESIFFEAITKIAKHSAVLIISGNHDDYVRLTASAALAEEHGIYIVGNNLRAIKCGVSGKCYPVKSGEGYAIFENIKGEQVYVNTLPYPNEARFKEGKTDETFEEKMSRWIALGEQGKVKQIPSVFLAHIFVCGGSASESEREIDLGGARLVPVAALPECDYVALGHLHKRQSLSDKIFYSGSIMRFAFDECNAVKSVNVFELDGSGLHDFKQIELKKIKNLVRLQALSAEDGLDLLNRNAEAYVELTLNLNKPLTRTQISELSKCENLVSLKTEVENGEVVANVQTRKGKSAAELFNDFYNAKYSAMPSEELKALFLEMTEEQ